MGHELGSRRSPTFGQGYMKAVFDLTAVDDAETVADHVH
jgi:hypothetical protein